MSERELIEREKGIAESVESGEFTQDQADRLLMVHEWYRISNRLQGVK